MPHDKLRDAMSNAGIAISEPLIADGKLHRFDAPGDRPKSGSGWYVFYDGDIAAAAFGCWKRGIQEKWCSKAKKDMSKEERAEYKRQMDDARKEREAVQVKVEEACRQWCKEAWTAAPLATDEHPYLANKGVSAYGLKLIGDSLMVPVRKLTGELVGVQFIQPEGTKKFKTGTAKHGAMHIIGKSKDDTLIIAEGYATAASIHMATGHAVLVAFDAGNLKPVAEAAQAKQPTWKIIIAADDDRWAKEQLDDGTTAYHEVPCVLKGMQRINTGITSATEAARAVKGELVRPRFKDLSSHPTDFNDLHALVGLDAVFKCVFPPPMEEYCPPEYYDLEPDHEPVVDYDKTPNPLNKLPVTLLGHDHGDYFYLPHGSKQVVVLRASEHTEANFIRMAPLQVWEGLFPGKQGMSTKAALNALMHIQHEDRKIYDLSRIRGRGAWEDEGRSVLHMGDHLIVNGKKHEIGTIKTSNIYELSIRMDIGTSTSDKMASKESLRLEELCKTLSWEKPVSATLLAGWCMVAPICGALSWRPHIHISGASSCGKSWVVENIVRPVAGPGALIVQGATTEAGIRQSLGNDARPVIYDEAEGEDRNAQMRMQSILELARQASSESGGSIYKGSTGGKATAFRIRSAFCFASIGVSATQQADQSRISVLTMKHLHDGGAYFKSHIKPLWVDVITKEFCQALRSRAISLIPVIRQNAEIFSEVVGHKLESKRTGDQIGCLLAGAFALYSPNIVDLQVAENFVDRQDWSEHQLDKQQLDELRCLAVILETTVDIGNGKQMSVAELIRRMNDMLVLDEDDDAQKSLKRHGIKVFKGGFCISNTHSKIKKILENTAWSNNWARILERLPGTMKHPQVWFSGGSSRAIMVPISYVLEGGE